MIKIQKINNKHIKVLNVHEEGDERPIYGSVIVGSNMFANIALIAKKHSGKTNVIGTIISTCALPRYTTVLCFSSTIHRDKTMIAIQKQCKHKKIPFIGYDSIFDSNINRLEEFLKSIEPREIINSDSEDETCDCKPLLFDNTESDDETKERKSKYRAPKYLVIFDDISTELRHPSIAKLLKQNRHYDLSCIVSTQYLTDLLPASRKQMDIWCVFQKFPLEKLENIYQSCESSLPFDVFLELYRYATQKRYSFFYIREADDEYRKNFNEKYDVSQYID